MIRGLRTSRGWWCSILDSCITSLIRGTLDPPCLSPPQMFFSSLSQGVMWSCHSISFLASLAYRSSARGWLKGTRQLPSPSFHSCRHWKTCHLPPELPLRKIPRSCMMALKQKISALISLNLTIICSMTLSQILLLLESRSRLLCFKKSNLKSLESVRSVSTNRKA